MKRTSKVSARTGMPLCMAGSRRTQTTLSTSDGNFFTARQHSALTLAMRAGILAGVLALPAMVHAAVIEFSVSGIVAQGVDELQLFSNVGESIVGKPYTMKFWLDTATLTDYGTGGAHGAGNANTGAPVHFFGAISMGNRNYSWSLEPDGRAGMYLGSESNAMMESSGGFGGWGRYEVWSMIGVFPAGATEPYFTSLEFEQRIEFKDFVDPWGYSSEFQLSYTPQRYPEDDGGYVRRTNFVGTGTYALWQVQPVPEPGQAGMLLAGVALVAGAALRVRRYGM